MKGKAARWRGLGARGVALSQCFILLATSSCVPLAAFKPHPGVLEYRSALLIDVAEGRVNLAGGNFVHRRVDLSIDTLFGEIEVGATYNSASRQWRWPFQMTYDGERFVDASGAVHDLGELADGDAIPGTHWVKLDFARIKTRGGLVHRFDPVFHHLVAITRLNADRPALVFFAEIAQGAVRVTAVSQCRQEQVCRLVYSIAYDEQGCVAGIEDRAGREVSLENDGACNPLVVRDALDRAQGWPGRRYEYSYGVLVAITNSEGERAEYRYEAGRLRAVERLGEGGQLLRLSHGREPVQGLFFTRVEDARGGLSVYRFDAEQRLLEWQNPAGDITRMTWSGRRPASRTGPDGAVTRWFYENDNPVRVEWPWGNVVLYEYALEGHDFGRPLQTPLARVTDSLGLVEERTYDVRGFPATVANGAGETRQSSYDDEGMLRILREPGGESAWMSDYGEHGHAETVSVQGNASSRVFDSVGNLLEGLDRRELLAPGRPGIRRRVFDEDRNLRSLELVGKESLETFVQEVASVEFSHRSDGKILGIERPYGGATAFEYDDLGRLSVRRERVDGLWHSRILEYGPGGDLSATELANGMRAEATHDVAGRPVRLSYRRDGIVEQELDLLWANGRVSALLDSRRPGVESLGYDAGGRLVSTRFPEGELLEREYDLRSREISRSFLLAGESQPLRRIEFSYDLANRQLEILDQGEAVLTRSFDQGRLGAIAYGNGLIRSLEYDPDSGVLVALDLSGGVAGPLMSTQLAWSECHQVDYCLTTSTQFDPMATAPLPGLVSEEHYVFGPRPEFGSENGGHGARLVASEFIGGSSSSGMGRHAFDVLGNWIGSIDGAGGGKRFAFNPERNRLLGSEVDGHHDYEWDESGFLVARDGTALRWNAAGKLSGIGDSIALEWDSLGRPISSTSPTGSRRTLFGGLMAGDSNRQPLSLDLGEVEIDLAGSGRLYRHRDFRGNVQAVSDDEARIVRFHTYSPFGVAASHGGGSDGRTFAGGRVLGDFVVLGARVYDPQAGRFISPDPSLHPLNAFAYTLGNPVTFWDPGGQSAEVVAPGNPVEVSRTAARVSSSLGSLLLSSAAHARSVPLALLGVGFLVLAGLANLVRLYFENRMPGMEVSIEDLPSGSGLDGTDPGGTSPASSDLGAVACSPLTIGQSRKGSLGAALLLPLQMLLAGLWLAWLRRRPA
ncbi:MAG: hypothetical protein NZ990_15135 [Myxococcota bacterium]|nr:hypothetical protein [Myxococcota bacterium]